MPRGFIYNDSERQLLIDLIKDFPVVKNKKTDGSTLSKKNKAWNDLAKLFNANSAGTIERTTDQLKKLWKNLKQAAKKDNAQLKREQRKTGGGTIEFKGSQFSEQVQAIGAAQILSLENEFDDDPSAIPSTSTRDGMILTTDDTSTNVGERSNSSSTEIFEVDDHGAYAEQSHFSSGGCAEKYTTPTKKRRLDTAEKRQSLMEQDLELRKKELQLKERELQLKERELLIREYEVRVKEHELNLQQYT